MEPGATPLGPSGELAPAGPAPPAEVVLLGDINIDLVLAVDALPRAGDDALAHGSATGLGGSAANTAVVLSRFGVRCSMLANVGRDEWSRQALAALRSEGVETTAVTFDPVEPTSLNVVTVTGDGERTMLAYRGASAYLRPEAVAGACVTRARALHLSGYALLTAPQRHAATEALRQARAAGVPVTLDVPVPAAQLADAELREVLPGLDLLVTGVPEARLLTGEDDEERCLDALVDAGVRTVALKLGSRGAVVRTAQDRVRVRGLAPVVVDTTGAGDAFAAGAIAGLLAGASLETVGALANACGAVAVTRRGAGLNLPTADEVRGLLGGSPLDPRLLAESVPVHEVDHRLGHTGVGQTADRQTVVAGQGGTVGGRQSVDMQVDALGREGAPSG